MSSTTMITGVILTAIGLFFIFFIKTISSWTAKFYQSKDKKKIKLIFRIAGLILILAGLALFLMR